jgi:cardiolipin synthase (CMP-forming)
MLPNIISLLRLLLVPLIILGVVDGRWLLALCGFVIAGLSDAIDGYIARHYNLRTELGAYLDPLADKALLVSIFLTLGAMGLIPVWLVILVVTRDFLIVGGILLAWVLGKPLAMQPSNVSKVNTVGQILFAGLLLGMKAFDFDMPGPVFYGSGAVAILTLVSMTLYLVQWLKHFPEDGK